MNISYPDTVSGSYTQHMKTLSVVDLILLILALVAFGAAAVGVAASRVNLIAVGLFLVTLTFLL